MIREISIQAGEEDNYIIMSRKIRKGKSDKIDFYNTELRNNYCTCPGFKYKFKCVHLKSVIQILKSKKIPIFHNKRTDSYYTNWDYRDIQELVKKEKFIY